jgi:hypothetical protein
MTADEELVMYIARDIFIENLRKGKNIPDGGFAKIVNDVQEGLDSLGEKDEIKEEK